MGIGPRYRRRLKKTALKGRAAAVADYELSEHETGLLLQVCRTVDSLDQLQARLDGDGPMVDSPQGASLPGPR